MPKMRMVALLGGSLLALSLFVIVPKTWGHVCVTCPQVTEGRMTGGGSIFTGDNDYFVPSGTRITHGFELHCDPADLPNNLEVNIHQADGSPDSTFHLDTVVYTYCWMDPTFSPNPPAAPFNSGYWQGVGRYNGATGYCADWTFTDAGEPGSNDRISDLRIWQAGTQGCSNGTKFVLSVSPPGHTLTFGNHQAHKDNN